MLEVFSFRLKQHKPTLVSVFALSSRVKNASSLTCPEVPLLVVFFSLLVYGLRMRRCQLALKHTTWKAQWLHFSNRLMTSILILASRTLALWENPPPPPTHARALVVTCTRWRESGAPTQVVSETERKPEKVGPCIVRERWIRKDQVSVKYDIWKPIHTESM